MTVKDLLYKSLLNRLLIEQVSWRGIYVSCRRADMYPYCIVNYSNRMRVIHLPQGLIPVTRVNLSKSLRGSVAVSERSREKLTPLGR